MHPSFWTERLIDLTRLYPLPAAALALVLVLLLFYKPKAMFKGFLFLGFVVLVFWVLSYLGEGTRTGMNLKEKAVHRTEKALE